MKPTLDEQDMTVYATDAQTIQEPFGSDYSQGVAVGKTIPAKWWNWLFKAATTRLHQAFNDLTNIFTELKNLVLTAGLTPDATDDTQITRAVTNKADTQIDTYVNAVKLRSFRFWRATANRNIKTLQNSSAEMFEYENGAVVRGEDAARGKFTDGQYSLDGGESWFNLHNRLPYCYLNGKYVFVVFRTSDTLSIFEEDTIDGYSSSHTPVASVQITTAAVSCNEFSTIIGTELFYMTQYGELIKYDAAQKTLTNTGVTASSLGLEYIPGTLRQDYKILIEPLQVTDKFFIGNLVYDGNTWQNACPDTGTIPNTPLRIRANKTALGTKVYFTAVPFQHNYPTCRVPVYDYVSGVSTLLPYYTGQNSVDDVLVCYKDYEHNNHKMLFSYDCENFTEVSSDAISSSSHWYITQLAEGYLIMCRAQSGGAYPPTNLVYIQGNLSDDASKYEVRSTISEQSANTTAQILVRAFEHGDGNIAFIISKNPTNTNIRNYCVYNKGSHIEEVDMDTQNIGLATDSFIPVMPLRKTSLMPAVRFQPLSVFLSTRHTKDTAFLIAKAAANTVVQNTLYLR